MTTPSSIICADNGNINWSGTFNPPISAGQSNQIVSTDTTSKVICNNSAIVQVTGNIDMQSTNKVTNLANATTGTDAMNQQASDARYYQNTTRLDQIVNPTASLNLNSQKIINLATPTLSTDGVNKNYVDNLVPKMAIVNVGTWTNSTTYIPVTSFSGTFITNVTKSAPAPTTNWCNFIAIDFSPSRPVAWSLCPRDSSGSAVIQKQGFTYYLNSLNAGRLVFAFVVPNQTAVPTTSPPSFIINLQFWFTQID